MTKWQKVKIKDYFDLQMGKTPARNNSSYWNDGIYKWVAISDIDDAKYISDTKEKISQKAVNDTKIKVVPQNIVIMSFKLSIGKTAITVEPVYTNEAIMAFIPQNEEKWNNHFLYYYLKNKAWTSGVNKAVMGTTLNKEALGNNFISCPPIEEQERIAKELDAVADLLEKQKQLLSEQDTLIKSIFYDMFGDYFKLADSYKILSEICKFIDYRGKTPEKADCGILLITAKNVRPNLFQSEPQEYISENTYESRMTRGFPQINDVMFTTEAPLGYVCRIPKLKGKFSVGQRIIVMHPYSEITSEYLEYALSSNHFQAEMYKHSSGSTARGIRSAELEKLSIPVPPLPLQQKFADIVEKIEVQKQKIKLAITETETLFNALMAKYFDEE